MLGAGSWLALRSGMGSDSRRAGLHVVIENFSQAAVLVTVWVFGLVVLQQFVGYRLSPPW
jgi:hypothetical protein